MAGIFHFLEPQTVIGIHRTTFWQFFWTALVIISIGSVRAVANQPSDGTDTAVDKSTDRTANPADTANHAVDKPSQKANPYLPRRGMSADDLQAYIERMQEAPESIHNRPGFAEGMAVAAQRLLDTNPTGSRRTFAVVNLLDNLHAQADMQQNHEADVRLAELAAKYASDSDKKIAAAAGFYNLEQRVLQAHTLKPDKLPELLDEVKTAMHGQTLDAKYLRIASGTVHVINLLSDDKLAVKQLQEFGQMFAASDNPVLARYGRKLQETAGPTGSESVRIKSQPAAPHIGSEDRSQDN
jgi:hypothetical protein